MAKVKVREVTLSLKTVIPVQQYGTVTIDLTAAGDVEDWETWGEAAQDLYQQMRSELQTMVKPVVQSRLRAIEAAIAEMPKSAQDEVKARLGPAIALATLMNGDPLLASAAAPEDLTTAQARDDKPSSYSQK